MAEIQPNQSNGIIPELSMILVVGGQRRRAGRALRTLLDQSVIDRMEILLFDLGPEESPPLPGSDHPNVRLERTGPDDLLTAARLRGIHAAKAPIVGFMEEHCEMQPGWAETVIAEHREPWAAVGGSFINANPDAGKSNTIFRLNYGSYVLPTGPRGPTRLIAGQNCSFKRDVLLRYEPNLELLLNAELILQRQILADGFEMLHEPSAKIAHRNETTLRSLAGGAFYWNWSYANIRAQVNKWGFLRRWTWIVLSPLIPWVRLVRLFRQELIKPTLPFSEFLRDIPFIVAIHHCSAVGQVFGLLKRGERAFRRFSHFEMNEPRPTLAELAR